MFKIEKGVVGYDALSMMKTVRVEESIDDAVHVASCGFTLLNVTHNAFIFVRFVYTLTDVSIWKPCKMAA